MSDLDFNSFNDPALRSAARRAWAAERAPQELREQIVALCPDLSRRSNRRPVQQPLSMRIRSTVYGLAVAAAFLLAVGLLFHVWDPGNPHSHRPVAKLPVDLAELVVNRHEKTASLADPRTAGIPQDDLGKMAKAMQQKIGFPVLTASLGGWRFQGASITKVGDSNAGELLFERVTTRRQYLSLFSLPLSFAGIEQSCKCDFSQVQNKHPIAGFATNGGFYCVITDDSLTLDQVRAIRDQLRPKMDPPIASAPVAVMGN